MKIKCDSCHNELKKLGGLLFSPPRKENYDDKIVCEKYHICRECFDRIYIENILNTPHE